MWNRNKMAVIIFILFITVLAMPGEAEASSRYDVLQVPAVKSTDEAVDLGIIKVTLNSTAIFAYSTVTVSLPSDLRFTANGDTRSKNAFCGSVNVTDTPPVKGEGITIVAMGDGFNDGLLPADFKDNNGTTPGYFNINPNNTFDIHIQDPVTTIGEDKYFYIFFYGIELNNINGDIEVDFHSPSGSAFSTELNVIIGKTVAATGSTFAYCREIVDLTNTDKKLGFISICENTPNTLTSDQPIYIEILTIGFTFDDTAGNDLVKYGWGFGNNAIVIGDKVPLEQENFNSAKNKLTFIARTVDEINDTGRLSFENIVVNVDPTLVQPGTEMKIRVSGENVTKQTLVVAKYIAEDNLQGTVELRNVSDRSGVLVSLYHQEVLINSTKTQPDGSYVFSNIAPGTYKIKAAKENWLGSQIDDVVVSLGKITTTAPIVLEFGDLNDDNIVDLFDMVILSQNYGKSGIE